MMTKLEKLVDLLIAIAEKHLNTPDNQLPLPFPAENLTSTAAAGASAPAVSATEEAVKKARKPRAPKEPAMVGGTSDAAMKAEHEAEFRGDGTEGLEDQLGIDAPKEMTEEESQKKMEEVTKQFVTLCKNDKPEDGKTRAIALMRGTFKVQKLGELSHPQRMEWIAEMEKGILGHK